MLMKTREFLRDPKPSLFHNMNNHPSSKPVILNLKQAQRFRIFLSTHARSVYNMYNINKTRSCCRNFTVFSSVEPGLPPSGPPPNIISWIVAVVVAVVIPFVNYKWGPTLKKKVESAMQVTEDVVEAVEKVAEDVEKVVEEISDDLPKGGKLKEAVDFVENLAEIAAKEAGAIDDFIDEVQEEEEKAVKIVESLQEELNKKPSEKSSGENLNNDNKVDK